MLKTVEERFWSKVNKTTTSGCWEWTAHLHKGYGQFGVKQGQIKYAHRVAYEWAVSPIPAGLELDHLCKNPKCVNPEHLEPVTRAENLARIISKPRRFVDLTNRIFGRLTAKHSVYDQKYESWGWFCECECGNAKVIAPVYRLTQGRTTSCGCGKSEKLSQSWVNGRHDHQRLH